MELLLPETPSLPHAGLSTPKAQRLRTWRDSPEWQQRASGDGGDLEQAAPAASPASTSTPASSASGWTTARPSELACTETAAEALGRLVGGGEMQSLSLSLAPPPTPTPAGLFQFGSPLATPVKRRPQHPQQYRQEQQEQHMLATRAGYASPLSTPRCSILSPGSIPPPSPPMLCLSPRVLQSMQPCSVKLTGSVRLCGRQIIPQSPHPPSQTAAWSASKAANSPGAITAAFWHSQPPPPSITAATPERPLRRLPSPAPSADAHSGTWPQAPKWHRELSFADLLCGQQQHGDSSLPPLPGTAASAAAPLLPRQLQAEPTAAGLVAEMALTPRKRARKSMAPLRAQAAEGEAPAGATQQGEQVSCQGESDDCPLLADDEWATHSTPRKAARHA